MNNKFDELAKGMAQSVTRRQALKKFGLGLAGMALACFGLASKADAGHLGGNGGGYLCCHSLGGTICVPIAQGCPYGSVWTKVGNCKKCV